MNPSFLILEKWTKISFSPATSINPNPFSSLNHFTVPCYISYNLLYILLLSIINRILAVKDNKWNKCVLCYSLKKLRTCITIFTICFIDFLHYTSYRKYMQLKRPTKMGLTPKKCIWELIDAVVYWYLNSLYKSFLDI